MAKQVMFTGGTFKTVKVGEGKDATYDLYLVSEVEGKQQEEKIGNNKKLQGAKIDARDYVNEKDPKATHYTIIHNKPGRARDAKEVLQTKAAI